MWLYSQGLITDPFRADQARYHLTPEGWEFYDRIRPGPLRYWLKHNWFPATVVAATILVGIGTILAQVLPLLLD